MRQVLCERSVSATGLSAGYMGFPGTLTGLPTAEVQARAAWMVPGTFSSLYIEIDTAPGSGKSWTFEIYYKLVATGVTVTIADTATSGVSSGSFATTGTTGDYLTLRVTSSGTPASSGGMLYSCLFDSTNTGESGYTQRQGSSPDNANPRKSGVFWSCYQSSSIDTWNNTNTAAELANIVPCDGAITGSSLILNQSPGGGTKAWTLVVYHAPSGSGTFTKQDGSGATTDTRVTCSNTTTANQSTFSLSVAAGDRVYYELIPENTPNELGTLFTAGTRYLADTDGQSIMGGWMKTAVSGSSGTVFFTPHSVHDAHSTTEGVSVIVGNPGAAFDVSKLYAHTRTAAGSSESWTLSVRRNGASPASPLLILFADPDQDGQDTSDTYEVADESVKLEMMFEPSSSSAAGTTVTWSMIQGAVAPTVTVTTIVGKNTTVAGLSSVFAIGLDGTTRTLSDTNLEGSVVLGGNLTMFEQASPPAAVAGVGRLYFEDDGTGKMRLMVQFPSGSAKQIEIET